MSKFKLCNAGQGLFYIGEIDRSKGEKFKFIYDCGGNNISGAINQHITKGEVIDMLVISHFDDDHINGLPDLFNKVDKIKKIFIPYYRGIEDYLLLMAYIYGNGATFDKVDEIVLVNSSEGVEDEQDFNEIITEEVPDINRYNLPNVKAGIIRNKVLSVEKKWIFKFYNARISTDINTVISDINNLISNNNRKDLEELLKLNLNAAKVGLRTIYSNYCSSKYNNSKQNQSSLCLYHAPMERETCGIHFMSYDRVYFRSCIETPCLGTMLTGDISLKTKKKIQNYDDFIKRYEKEAYNTGIFLLPHHGANNNWNSLILEDFMRTPIFLNSSGINNRFKHPGSMVIKELQNNGRIVCFANEYLTVEYYI
jgi:hypothetical protein